MQKKYMYISEYCRPPPAWCHHTKARVETWRPRELIRECPTIAPLELLHTLQLHVLGVNGEHANVLETTFIIT